MAFYDAPNQEVVGVGPPWVEGDGGTPDAPPPENGGEDLDAMTKDELVEEAGRRGVDTKADWTKAEIREAIEAS